MIEIDLNARILPEDHNVFVVRRQRLRALGFRFRSGEAAQFRWRREATRDRV
jgi:hypothetical protein